MSSVKGKRRPGVWVDLTGSDEENARAPAKKPRPNKSTQGLAKQPLSAATSNSSQRHEADYLFDLSQEGEVDIDAGWGLCKLGTTELKIVGCQYYRGEATIGERVLVQREIHNQYDRNAIRICNVRGEQIGHVPRAVAGAFAPYVVSKVGFL